MNKLNKEIPRLSEDAANKLLANVFDSCLQEPNTIPLTTLQSYSEYRRERYGLQKILLIIVLIIFLLLPLCFLSPEVSINKSGLNKEGFPTYTISVDSVMPIAEVIASIGNSGLPVTEIANRTYSVAPHENGTMKVYVKAINYQYSVTDVTVDGVDIDPPVMESNNFDGEKLHLFVTDAGVGIDYDGIYGVTDKGIQTTPVSAADGKIDFSVSAGSMDIYIPDKNKNILHLVITVTQSP